MGKYIFYAYVLVVFLFFGWLQRVYTYPLHEKIEFELVHHPKIIPPALIIRIIDAGYTSVVADMYWLSTVQYVGTNAASGAYKQYMYALVNLITDLNPKFIAPYELGGLLLPLSSRDEADDVYTNILNNTKKLGEKGIKNTCDSEKINIFMDLFDSGNSFSSLMQNSDIQNPCLSYLIPHHLGYLLYWNLNSPLESSKYYTLAATHEDAPNGVKILAATLQGKGGKRETSITMFLSLLESSDDTSCSELGSLLLKEKIFTSDKIDGFVSKLPDLYAMFKKDASNKNDSASHLCLRHFEKVIRELNLAYLEKYDGYYFEQFGRHSKDASELFYSNIIPKIPEDPQKLGEENKNSKIIYFFDEDRNLWDYKAGQYLISSFGQKNESK